ncbi:alpha-1,2-mannosyltransferase Alg9 isoform X2 [Arctopsyche grandis]|uniref:alpha-1,2-mannosyltransferase Alg9 isoform X2 n=1 Tax=Arctopsyche grandis TaxID=121162 RepID=UPI00406D97BA
MGGGQWRRRAGRARPRLKAPDVIPNREVIVTNAPTNSRGITFPGSAAAFRALVSARFCSAVWCHISDCDEVFNYWEPIHYLVYGWGLQTWEYSAAAALRSYTSLWLVGGPSAVVATITSTAPPALLYLTRCLLALAAATGDLFFYKSVCQEFGVHIGRMWLAFSLTSAGGFIAGAAMLPSAWCCTLTSLALAAWWKHNYPLAIIFTALSALIGWPFAGLLGLPIAIDLVFKRKQPMLFIQWCGISLLFILGPMVYIDSEYYGHLVIAPWNLVKYNVLTDHGPDLYGTEPWTFYFVNGFLNYNIVWILALICPLLLWACEYIPNVKPRVKFCQPYWLSLMPLYSWLAVFMLQPHKEERFLFPIYPMICLCGAISVDCLQKLVFRVKPTLDSIISKITPKLNKAVDIIIDKKSPGNHYVSHTRFIMLFFMVVSTLLGVSRNIGLYQYYHAPMDILRGLAEEEVSLVGNINVCYGKEWHRFPSSFLFPDSRYRIGFVKSAFDGILPAYYGDGDNATMLAPDHFNDMNREEPKSYIEIGNCHYFVDSTIGDPGPLEPSYADDVENWTIVKSGKLSMKFWNSSVLSFS